jgi:hypothetical protein
VDRAQLRHDKRIRLRAVPGHRQRTGRVHQAGDINVVLQQHRNAVQGTAHTTRRPLGVQCAGLRDRIGIDLNHRVEHWPGIIDAGNAKKIRLRQRP